MEDTKKEVKMNPREQDIVPGGPSREEVEELNRPKTEQSKSPPAVRRSADSFGGRGKSKIPGRVANVVAAVATALPGGTFADQIHQTVNNPLPARVEEVKPDPKRDIPPSTPGVKVTFTQDIRSAPVPDGSVGEVQYKYKAFVPRVLKDVSQAELDAAERPPLYLREFGAPERGVIMRNKVEQGGANPAWVEMGDSELFEDMMYLRGIYGAKDEDGKPLKLEITFYSSYLLLQRDRNRSLRSIPPTVIYWDNWAGDPGIYQNGIQEFHYREADKTLEFRITLPETLPGKIPTEDSVNKMHRDFVHLILEDVLSQKDGKRSATFQRYASGEEPEYSDFLAHPVVMTKREPRPSFFSVSRSALWIK